MRKKQATPRSTEYIVNNKREVKSPIDKKGKNTASTVSDVSKLIPESGVTFSNGKDGEENRMISIGSIGNVGGGTAINNKITLNPDSPIPFGYNNRLAFGLSQYAYVPFLSDDDNYAQILMEAKLLSPTTLACINSKVHFCVDKGLVIENDKKDPKYDTWSKSVNLRRQNFTEVITEIFNNYFTYGNCYVELVRGSFGNISFVKPYVHNTQDVRLDYPDDDNIVHHVLISRWFRREMGVRFSDFKTVRIPLYDPNPLMQDSCWVLGDDGYYHTVIHIKRQECGFDHYGLPSNVGALPLMLLEYKCSRYNLDEFENNLSPGGILFLKGQASKTEAFDLAKNIVKQHTGDGKQGRWLVMSGNGQVDDIEVKPFDNKKDGDFIELMSAIQDMLFISNEWNKILVGGSLPTGLGHNGQIFRSVFDIYNNSVIHPTQCFIMGKFVNPFFQIHDKYCGTKFAQMGAMLITNAPDTFMGDLNINAILTKNEGRAIIGKQPIKGDEWELPIEAAKTNLETDRIAK